jgi:hypothetical protein
MVIGLGRKHESTLAITRRERDGAKPYAGDAVMTA